MTRPRSVRTIAVVVALGSVVGASAAGARPKPGPVTTLVSVNLDGTSGGNGQSRNAAISANGRFVAFYGAASDLVSNDGNGKDDVFVRDLKSGTTKLVSLGAARAGAGNGTSIDPSISANGRFVAFTSDASDLVAGDANGLPDVFVRDLRTGRTRLVSVNAAGTGGANQASFGASISADGRYVAFHGGATDIVAIANDRNSNVFLRDLRTGRTRLVSVNAAGTGGGNQGSYYAAVSSNGRFVAFASLATDLVAGDLNAEMDAYLRDMKTGTTTLVSVNALGTGSGSGWSQGRPAVSADGRLVAFQSAAGDLVTNDTNGIQDVFVRDLRLGRTSLVSVNLAGANGGDGHSEFPSITANGRFVAFDSRAGDLVTDLPGGWYDVFVRDLRAGATTLVSVNAAGTGAGNDNSYAPSISADGRVVAFGSQARDLVPIDTDRRDDVLVRRLR